jgi:hypothetical protein
MYPGIDVDLIETTTQRPRIQNADRLSGSHVPIPG